MGPTVGPTVGLTAWGPWGRRWPRQRGFHLALQWLLGVGGYSDMARADWEGLEGLG